MRAAIAASAVIGILWNVIVVRLMGGRITTAFAPAWLLAGAAAGVVVGLATIRSRRSRDGEERFGSVLAAYYLGIAAYWASFVVVARIVLVIQHHGWTSFDLRDHLTMIFTLLAYGTLPYGALLIPLAFASRHVVWKIYNR